jgi:hypothetical protein
MRARELIQEDYNENLESDLSNLLIAAKASGAANIDTQAVVDQLYGMGYAVNANSIMLLLSRNPVVLNATPQSITLTQPEGTSQSGGDPSDDAGAKVSDMAAKAVDIG